MNVYVPPRDRPGMDWSYGAKVEMVLSMSERTYNAVVHNITVTFSTAEIRDTYLDAAHAYGELRDDGIDRQAVLAFRGHPVDPYWLAAALRAGFTEAEIRAFLAADLVPPRDELEVLAALRCG